MHYILRLCAHLPAGKNSLVRLETSSDVLSESASHSFVHCFSIQLIWFFFQKIVFQERLAEYTRTVSKNCLCFKNRAPKINYPFLRGLRAENQYKSEVLFERKGSKYCFEITPEERKNQGMPSVLQGIQNVDFRVAERLSTIYFGFFFVFFEGCSGEQSRICSANFMDGTWCILNVNVGPNDRLEFD